MWGFQIYLLLTDLPSKCKREEHGAAEAHIVLGFNQHRPVTTSRASFPDSNKITSALASYMVASGCSKRPNSRGTGLRFPSLILFHFLLLLLQNDTLEESVLGRVRPSQNNNLAVYIERVLFSKLWVWGNVYVSLATVSFPKVCNCCSVFHLK